MFDEYRRHLNHFAVTVSSLCPDVPKDHYKKRAIEYEEKCMFRSAALEWRLQGFWAKHYGKATTKFQKKEKECFRKYFRLTPFLKLLDLEAGVGFTKKGVYCVHRCYEDVVQRKTAWFERAKELLPHDYSYDLLEISSAGVSFLKVPGFDKSLQPSIEETVHVSSGGKVVRKAGSQKVITEKWLWVKEEYPGFNYFNCIRKYLEALLEGAPETEVKHTFLYALVDPREPTVLRYIGKTDDLPTRLNQHIVESKKENSTTRKNLWIKSLLVDGVLPEIKLVGTVEWRYEIEWVDQEIACIEKHRRQGHPLTNTAIFGHLTQDFHQMVKMRKRVWEENPTPDNEFKYRLYSLLKDVTFVSRQIERKAKMLFAQNTFPSIESELMLERIDAFCSSNQVC